MRAPLHALGVLERRLAEDIAEAFNFLLGLRLKARLEKIGCISR